MIVKAIYHAAMAIYRIYHKREIIFQGVPVVFHIIEDGKLIILGAHTANSLEDGLYIDCEPELPEVDWIYPVQNGNVLTIEQVYKATQNGNVLEVE